MEIRAPRFWNFETLTLQSLKLRSSKTLNIWKRWHFETWKVGSFETKTFFILRATPSAASPFWLLGLPFGMLGVSILTFWGTVLAPRAHLGGPFGHLVATLDDHMEFQHFQMENLIHYWDILGPMYISFLGSRSLTFYLFRACFQVTFFIDFLTEISTLGTPKSRFSQCKYCKKTFVHWNCF